MKIKIDGEPRFDTQKASTVIKILFCSFAYMCTPL